MQAKTCKYCKLPDGREIMVLKVPRRKEIEVYIQRPTLPSDTKKSVRRAKGFKQVSVGSVAVITGKGITQHRIRITLDTAIAVGQLAEQMKMKALGLTKAYNELQERLRSKT